MLQGELYESRKPTEHGALLYNVGALAVGRVDVCALDTDLNSAEERWERCAQGLEASA